MADQKMASLVNLRKALAPKDAHLHFIDIETHGQDEGMGNTIQYYAAALYEVEDSPRQGRIKAPPVRPGPLQGRALKGRHYDWWVEVSISLIGPKSYKVER